MGGSEPITIQNYEAEILMVKNYSLSKSGDVWSKLSCYIYIINFWDHYYFILILSKRWEEITCCILPYLRSSEGEKNPLYVFSEGHDVDQKRGEVSLAGESHFYQKLEESP